MRYLLDTCVISELASKRPDPHVIQWVDSIQDERLYLSVITIGEIKKGIEKLSESKRKQSLSDWLQQELIVRFKDRILPLDLSTILTWGELVAQLELRGQPMPAIDSLVAAIALHGSLTLVTRNVADFANSDVGTFNPWHPL